MKKKRTQHENTKPSAIFERWKNGTTIHELVAETKMTRSQMRRLLTQAAGGKAQFRELRAAGAGGKTIPFGGKRATGPRTSKPAPNDKKLKFVKTTDWPFRFVPEHEPRPIKVKLPDGVAVVNDTGGRILVVKSPKTGREYVRALDHEPANFLHRGISDGMPPLRFVEWKKSLTRQKVERHIAAGEKQAERGEAALERVKQRKSVARAARKARKAEKNTRTRTRGGK